MNVIWRHLFRLDGISEGTTIQREVPQKARPWPRWAVAIALLKAEGERGIGDTVQRIIGDDASEAFKQWYLKTFGHECGCAGRQNDWNALYPYK